jgi:hypothetical protein
MSTIQQLKNFIRHGKQARATQDAPPPPTSNKTMPAISEPVMVDAADAMEVPIAPPQPVPGAVSAVDGDVQNRAAQAGHIAAHAADQLPDHHQQPPPVVADGATPDAKKAKKRIDSEEIARLVAEENESRAKFTRYPGLERWVLIEKMGDGAFSNVYKARDTTGEHGEVAIKVVRKYEMNSMQVSSDDGLPLVCCLSLFFLAVLCFRFACFCFPPTERVLLTSFWFCFFFWSFFLLVFSLRVVLSSSISLPACTCDQPRGRR